MTATLLDTAQKVSVFGVILVRIFPTFPHIWTEYGEILRMSPYSVRMWGNAGRMRTRINTNADTFYAVAIYLSVFSPNAGKMRTRKTPNTSTFYAVGCFISTNESKLFLECFKTTYGVNLFQNRIDFQLSVNIQL